MENYSDQNNQNCPPPQRPFNRYESLRQGQPNLHEKSGAQCPNFIDNLQYNTGGLYLTGLILGGAKGTMEGIMAAELGDTTNIRVNRILNAGGHVGRKYGNSLGVLGFLFGLMEGGIIYYRDGNDGISSSVLAGMGVGAIYKARSGPRTAALAGVIGGLAAAAAKQAVLPAIKRYVPI